MSKLYGPLLPFLRLPVHTTMSLRRLKFIAEQIDHTSYLLLHGKFQKNGSVPFPLSAHIDIDCLRIKIPYPFQWGTPIFAASHIFGMIGAVLVSACEVKFNRQNLFGFSHSVISNECLRPCFAQSTGAHYAAARLAGATPPPAYVLSRSVGLQVKMAFVIVHFV